MGTTRLSFLNWYKRRYARLIPSLFAYAIFVFIVWGKESSFTHLISGGQFWFVRCILVYYVLLFFTQRYFIKHLWWVLGGYCMLFVLFYIFHFYPMHISFYGSENIQCGLRQLYYFIFMLFGAIVGYKQFDLQKSNVYIMGTGLFVSVVLWYGMCYFFAHNWLIIFSLIPLVGICYFLFCMLSSIWFIKLMANRFFSSIVYFVSILSLECYLIQFSLFTDKFNSIFPLNIIGLVLLILVSAYIIRCGAIIIRQTFNNNDYNWNELLISNPYKNVHLMEEKK